MRWRDFLTELQRRNVYKVGVGYAAVAWLVSQIATSIFPLFEIPATVLRWVILLLVAGFPIALILAWVVELTADGLHITKDAIPGEVLPKTTGRFGKTGWWMVGAVLFLGLGLLIFQKTRPGPVAKTPLLPSIATGGAVMDFDPQSIAVLPFENLSEEKANAYFASGIQDEVLTALAQISGLKVISRTSTQRYASAPGNLKQIAQELKVAHILEGSVQRSGDQVRVNVQLIEAATDTHRWAQTYDRKLDDVFRVQGEVAQKIADELRTTLSPEEKSRVQTQPTQNTEAWLLYLQARECDSRVGFLRENALKAAQLYEKAIVLDPSFALALARLSARLSENNHGLFPSEETKARARTTALDALRLQPDLGEAHLALGLSYYWGDGDFERGLEEFSVARKTLPNNGELRLYTAAIHRRQGRWREAIAGYQKAQSLDPFNRNILQQLVLLYNSIRDWPAAAKVADQVVVLSDGELNPKIVRASIDFWTTGDTGPLQRLLDAQPPDYDPENQVSSARYYFSMLLRDYPAAKTAFKKIVFTDNPMGNEAVKVYYLGTMELAEGDIKAARLHFEAARGPFEEYLQKHPDESSTHANLGMIYAGLGRHEDAKNEGLKSVDLLPAWKDQVRHAQACAGLAMILAQSGYEEEAITLIEKLLTTPGAVTESAETMTYQDLKQRWEWDALRNNPRFQKIMASPEPKTIFQ